VQLGVGLPTANLPQSSVEAIGRVAQAAERLGYDAVWTFERLLYPTGNVEQPGGPPRPLPEYYQSVFDPLETLSWVAAQTSRVKLGTSIIDALFHTPVILSKRFATLDQLSGGRVIAGLGQGWMAQEFAAANVPPSRKGAGLEEFVAAMRAAWGSDPVCFEGRWYTIPDSIIRPKPVQPGGPPIVFGAMTPAGLQRAARVADGINPIAFSLEMLSGLLQGYRTAVSAAGRDPSSMLVHVRVNNVISPQPLPEGQRSYLGGSAEQIVADLEGLRELDVNGVFIGAGGAASVDQEEELLGELMRRAVQAGLIS
jgi:probable F420-dependent oxidoreductase